MTPEMKPLIRGLTTNLTIPLKENRLAGLNNKFRLGISADFGGCCLLVLFGGLRLLANAGENIGAREAKAGQAFNFRKV